MEALSRLVVNSLSRHGLDRPVDPRRLQWSRWFRCDSPHSLLVVPSRPGIFALAEEVMDLAATKDFGSRNGHVGTAALECPGEQSSAVLTAPAAEPTPPRMLAVLHFSEVDDMAFVLDRMFTRINPMRTRLASGRCFVRFVVIQDVDQRRGICTTLNQWIYSSAEKATGLSVDFFSSFELSSTETRVGNTLLSASPSASTPQPPGISPACAKRMPNIASAVGISHLDSGAARNLHRPQPLPSGF